MTQSLSTVETVVGPLASLQTSTLRQLLVSFRAEGDHVAARLIDTELFYRQPIVTHEGYYGEWTATRGDYDLDCTVGSGRTEADAIADLVEREEDQRDYELLVSANHFLGAPGGDEFDDGGMAEERSRHP